MEGKQLIYAICLHENASTNITIELVHIVKIIEKREFL